MGKMQRAIKTLEKTEDIIVIFAVGLALILCCIQVTARYVWNYPLSWPEELCRYLVILVVYVGASIALRKKKHIVVDIIPTFFPGSARVLDWVSDIFGIVFSLIIIIYGTKFVRSLFISGQIAITLKIPIFIVYSILPLGGALLLIHYIIKMVNAIQNKKFDRNGVAKSIVKTTRILK